MECNGKDDWIKKLLKTTRSNDKVTLKNQARTKGEIKRRGKPRQERGKRRRPLQGRKPHVRAEQNKDSKR